VSEKKVFFSIPLMGRRNEQGWKVACSTLANTLNSIRRQTDPEFEVVITGHERPDIDEMDDRRITFIEAGFQKPTDPSRYSQDKYKKRATNILHIKKQGAGYVMMLDADDLVSRNLVRYIREQDAPYGYTLRKGYALDYSSGVIAPVPGAWPCSFNKLCGSCTVLYLTPGDIGSSLQDMHESFYGRFRPPHSKWEETAMLAERPLHPVSFPAVVYVLNTSLNTSWILTKKKDKEQTSTAKISKHRLLVSPDMIDEFSLAPVLVQAPRQRWPFLKNLHNWYLRVTLRAG
jgi:hypothetical protein